MRKKRDPLAHIAEALRPLAEPLDSLKPDPRNARQHGEKNLAAIAASLKTFGQRKPIVVNRKNHQVEAGNGLLEAAKSLGWTHLAVVWVDDDPAAQTGFSLADNRAAELAAWDDATLAILLGELHGDNEELYEALAFEDLLESLEEEAPPAAGATGSASAEEEQDEPEAQTEAAADPEPAAVQVVPEQYAVVIDCGDETQQRAVYEKCKAEGWQCQVFYTRTSPTRHFSAAAIAASRSAGSRQLPHSQS